LLSLRRHKFVVTHQPLIPGERGGVNKQQQAAKPSDNGATAAYSVLPLMDSGRRPDENADKSMVRPEEIARTANRHPKLPAGTNPAGIPPFGNSQVANTALNQPGTPPTEVAQTQGPLNNEVAETRSEREALEKPSLIFVRANRASNAVPKPQDGSPAIDLGICMPPAWHGLYVTCELGRAKC
jgi:hypothetical protein